MIYSLQDAEAKFSEFVGLCLREGPQTVTRHGRNAVVVVPYDDYQRLTAHRPSLGQFFRAAQRVELEVVRSRELGRKVSFDGSSSFCGRQLDCRPRETWLTLKERGSPC